MPAIIMKTKMKTSPELPSERSDKKLVWKSSFSSTQVLAAANSGDEATHETGVAGFDTENGTKDHVLKITDADGDTGGANIHFGRLSKGVFHWKFAFAFADSSTATTATFKISHRDGTNLHDCEFFYDVANKKWEYKNAAGSTVDFTDGAQDIVNNYWHVVEMVVDLVNDKILFFQCDDIVVVSSALASSVYVTTNTVDELHIHWKLYSNGQTNKAIYIDACELWSEGVSA